MSAPATPVPGTVLGNRYSLGPEIASGGVGRVYRADDRLLGRVVAVKVLRSEVARTPGGLDRFRREARAAAALMHANVATVYDFGQDGDVPFLVMEHVDGENLAERLSRGPLPVAEALRVAVGVAEALGYAHRHEVVHRDVKPANVLLSAGGPKVTDFGIARLLHEPGVTATGIVIGTPSYLAPEQALGRPATPATDLYALGVLLFEMLAGRPPFADSDPMAVMAQHIHAPVPPLRVEGLPDSVARLMTSLLAKEPGDRPADAFAAARTLKAALLPTNGPSAPTTQAVPAPSPPTAFLPRKARPRRSRRGMVVGCLITAFCLLFLLLGFFMARAAFPQAVSTPNLSGLAVHEARSRAEAAGFDLVVDGSAPSRTRRDGEVVSQVPGPGQTAIEGSRVHVTISSGRPLVRVPDLRGLTRDEAMQVLSLNNLSYGGEEIVFSDSAANGTVVGSDPAPGESVVETSSVQLRRTRTNKEWADIVSEVMNR